MASKHTYMSTVPMSTDPSGIYVRFVDRVRKPAVTRARRLRP